MSKFDNVPVEDDTAIILSLESTLDKYDVLYQQWFWDGMNGESIIFVAEEVQSMDDDALKGFVAESPLVKDKEKITMTRNSKGYTFVNFNFVSITY